MWSPMSTGKSDKGRYRVHLDGEWVIVPDGAVITEPNKIGRTMRVEALYRRPSARALLHAGQHDVERSVIPGDASRRTRNGVEA